MFSADLSPQLFEASGLFKSLYKTKSKETLQALIRSVVHYHWKHQYGLTFVIEPKDINWVKNTLLNGPQSNFTFDWSDDTRSKKEQFKLKINADIPSLIPNIEAIINYEALTNRRADHYKSLITPSDALHKALLRPVNHSEKQQDITLLALKFSDLIKENIDLKSIKEEALALKKQFPKGIKKQILSNNFSLKPTSSVHQGIASLKTKLTQLEELIQDYLKTIADEKEKIKAIIKEDYLKLQAFINPLKRHINVRHLQSKYRSPKTKLLSKFFEKKHIPFEQLEVPKFAYSKHQTIAEQYLLVAQGNAEKESLVDLDNWTLHLKSTLEKALSAFNPVNLQDPHINKLEGQISEIISHINTLEIVKQNIEFYPINLLQKEKQLWQIKAFADDIHAQLDAQAYLIHWQLDPKRSIETKNILMELVELSTDTIQQIFDHITQEKWLEQAKHPAIYDTTSDIEQLIKNKQEYLLATEQLSWLKQIKTQANHIQNIKTHQAAIYTALFRKKRSTHIEDVPFARQFASQIETLFPFQIVSTEQREILDTLTPEKLIYINPIQEVPEEHAITIKIDTQTDKNSINQFAISAKKISQLGLRDQLPYATQMAESISLLCDGNFEVHSRGNHNIISFLSKSQQIYFREALAEKGYKVLHFSDQGENLLTEILLNTQAQTTFIETDYLLSLKHYAHFGYQRNINKVITGNDIRLVNMNTKQFIEAPVKSINKLIEEATTLAHKPEIHV